MRNLRARIERLEAMEPEPVILKLSDGSYFHYEGSLLGFFEEASEDIREKASSPLLTAVLNTISAQGCGSIWRLVRAMVPPSNDEPVLATDGTATKELQGGETNAKR